jgi:hypothetical protein
MPIIDEAAEATGSGLWEARHRQQLMTLCLVKLNGFFKKHLGLRQGEDESPGIAQRRPLRISADSWPIFPQLFGPNLFAIATMRLLSGITSSIFGFRNPNAPGVLRKSARAGRRGRARGRGRQRIRRALFGPCTAIYLPDRSPASEILKLTPL